MYFIENRCMCPQSTYLCEIFCWKSNAFNLTSYLSWIAVILVCVLLSFVKFRLVLLFSFLFISFLRLNFHLLLYFYSVCFASMLFGHPFQCIAFCHHVFVGNSLTRTVYLFSDTVNLLLCLSKHWISSIHSQFSYSSVVFFLSLDLRYKTVTFYVLEITESNFQLRAK